MKTLALLCVPFLVGASGCGAGTGSCDPQCSGEKAECGQLGSHLSALAALDAAGGSARSSLGGEARWVGAIQGQRITHDGVPTTEPDADLFGSKVYTAGWVFKYCAGLDEIVYGAGPPTSSAQRGCGTFNCGTLGGTPPQVDSPAAVSAAFPTDPSSTLYGLGFNLTLDGSRAWRVTRLSDGKSVNVDGDSGVVLP